MRHIAIARFGHEGNSFASVKTSVADFKASEWATGDGVVPFYRGTNTEIGGAIGFIEQQTGWTPHYLRSTFATPSGEVERDAFETIMQELLDGLSTRRWDAVYLGQHGAMQVDGMRHADHEIIRRVRGVIGDAPLGVSYDLHANITQEQLDMIDVCVGYKCHPHTDMAATAEKTLRLLFQKIDGKVAPLNIVKPMNAFLPSINGRTTDGPMAEVAAFARGLERGAKLLDLTVYQGYAYGDRDYAGGSVTACVDDDRAAAESAIDATIAEVERVRERLFIEMPSAEEGIARALKLVREGKKPVAVIDSADHPGAGANADTPGLLRALLDAKPDVPSAFVFFWDPAAVATAVAAGIGGSVELSLGGRLTGDFGPPIKAKAKVTRLTDGRVVHVGPFCNGLVFNYGRTAVLDIEGIAVVITETCLMVTDPAFFDLHGIDLKTLGVLAIKAKNQFRAAFTGTFAVMIDVDVPGPAAYDFTRLPFTRVPKTHFPFSGRGG